MNVPPVLVDTWSTTAKQLGNLYGFVSPGDIQDFERRCHAEGITYITTTLPKLGKALERSFMTGVFELPAEFKARRGCHYAQFLHKAFAALFTEDGTCRFDFHTADFSVGAWIERDVLSSAVLVIRQLTLMYYKLEMPYPVDVEKAFISKFKSTDRALKISDQNLDTTLPLLTRAAGLVKRLLHRFDPMDILPKHGSGSSSCGLSPVDRYGSPRYFPQIDTVYKYTEWYFTSVEHVGACYPDLFEDSELDVPTAKVVLIPKDSRGPRLISMEPRETMYLQQGLMAKLYEAIDHYPTVRQQLSCTDQSRNRALALLGSETGGYATLDLEEASDRVSWKLVEILFPPNWVESLRATRSSQTMLPDGSIFPLQKFAPMGSACCFPVECIVFWAVTLAATLPTDYNLSCLFRSNPLVDPLVAVSVFGDDIIVPTAQADKAIAALTSVGLKVNEGKSFTRGPFRESCGGDYFLGRNVAPVRIKHLPSTNPKRNQLCFSKFRLCNFINNLVARFHVDVYPFRELFTKHYGRIDVVVPPYGDRLIAALVLYGDYDDLASRRFNPHLFKSEALLLTERGIDETVDLDDRSCLLRWYLTWGPESSIAEIPVRDRYRYKKGWIAIR